MGAVLGAGDGGEPRWRPAAGGWGRDARGARRAHRLATREWRAATRLPADLAPAGAGQPGRDLSPLRRAGLVSDGTLRLSPAALDVIDSFRDEAENKHRGRYADYAMLALDRRRMKIVRTNANLTLQRVGKRSRLTSARIRSRRVLGEQRTESRSRKILTTPRTELASAPAAAFPPNLGCAHYQVLLNVTNDDARAFYEIEAARESWSSRELEREVGSLLFERLARSRDKHEVLALARRGAQPESPADVIKEPFVLEFLGLDERSAWRERDLEQALIDRIEAFLLELGKGFCFVVRQKRLTLDGDHFFVDLVLYNRLLRCFVLVDLKFGKLTHQDLGQMQMYVNFYDRFQRAKGEAKTIGIVLCRKKNDAMAKITLPEDNAQILARRYQMYLPTEAQLRAELARDRERAERALQAIGLDVAHLGGRRSARRCSPAGGVAEARSAGATQPADSDGMGRRHVASPHGPRGVTAHAPVERSSAYDTAESANAGTTAWYQSTALETALDNAIAEALIEAVLAEDMPKAKAPAEVIRKACARVSGQGT